MKFELYDEMISYQTPPPITTTTSITTTNTNTEGNDESYLYSNYVNSNTYTI